METFFGLIIFVLTIALIIGLVNPSKVLKWSKKPTRLKVVGWWFLAAFVVVFLFDATKSENVKAEESIEAARKYIERSEYDMAISRLASIKEDNALYTEAQTLLRQADSLNNITDEDRAAAKRLEDDKALKERLKDELELIESGMDFSVYTGSLEALSLEIVLFRKWGTLISSGENSDDAEIHKLAGELKQRVINIQTREFPRLRKEFIDFTAKKLWEDNVEVEGRGAGNRQIYFTGGVFASNRNKKKFQEDIHAALKSFRFTRSNYRWYEYEDKIPYYNIFEGKDSDLVN